MSTTTVHELYFSPTGKTFGVVDLVAQEISHSMNVALKKMNITLPQSRKRDLYFSKHDIVILGFPVYAGKLPNKILPFIKNNIHFHGARVVALVTFGNRSFDNALAELTYIVAENGGELMGAAACVVPHVFSATLGEGRPNASDVADIKDFAHRTIERIYKEKNLSCADVSGDAEAPYYTPLGIDGAPVMFLKAKPKTYASRCVDCKKCAHLCPMAAIDLICTHEVPGTCIKCQSCVQVCPHGAKYFDDEAFLSHVAMLEHTYAAPAKNYYYG
ncbi:MAG: EFR1 family ferrodoxin [Eggerthellaceae bacterium]|nr:EFR1 family ferrodoxin [Eggerthellaceae bacterium]